MARMEERLGHLLQCIPVSVCKLTRPCLRDWRHASILLPRIWILMHRSRRNTDAFNKFWVEKMAAGVSFICNSDGSSKQIDATVRHFRLLKNGNLPRSLRRFKDILHFVSLLLFSTVSVTHARPQAKIEISNPLFTMSSRNRISSTKKTNILDGGAGCPPDASIVDSQCIIDSSTYNNFNLPKLLLSHQLQTQAGISSCCLLYSKRCLPINNYVISRPHQSYTYAELNSPAFVSSIVSSSSFSCSLSFRSVDC